MHPLLENAAIQGGPEFKASARNPCPCLDCTVTVVHWMCDTCPKGPFRFDQTRPFQRRMVCHKVTLAIVGCRYSCSIRCFEKDALARLQAAQKQSLKDGRVEKAKHMQQEIIDLTTIMHKDEPKAVEKSKGAYRG